MAEAKLAKYVALFDSVGYHNADGDTLYASKGEEFELDEKQAKRHLDLGSVATPRSKDAKEASAEAEAEAETEVAG